MELDEKKLKENGWKQEHRSCWSHKLNATILIPKNTEDFSKGFKKVKLQYHIEQVCKKGWELLLLTNMTNNKNMNNEIVIAMLKLNKANVENVYKVKEPKIPPQTQYKGIKLF